LRLQELKFDAVSFEHVGTAQLFNANTSDAPRKDTKAITFYRTPIEKLLCSKGF
jgi:hypothetical protein